MREREREKKKTNEARVGVCERETWRPRQEVESERMKKYRRAGGGGNLSRRQAAFWQRELVN